MTNEVKRFLDTLESFKDKAQELSYAWDGLMSTESNELGIEKYPFGYDFEEQVEKTKEWHSETVEIANGQN